jgi:hypothetical protein
MLRLKYLIRIRTISYGLAALIMLLPSIAFSQHDLTLYSMDKVPQRIYLNPSFIPEQNTYVGFPFLSGVHTSIANPFTYNNILTREEDDSLNFEAEHFLEKIAKNDHINLFTSIDILSVGGKIAKSRFFLNFGLRERITQNLYLPENLFTMLWYGNTAPQVWDQHVNIAPAFNASLYDEWSFTFAGYAMKKKLTFGATVKYLSGRINVTTKKSEFDFYTDPANYNVNIRSDLEFQTSGINEIDTYLDQRVPSLIFPGNNGFALDLGASYQINDHFSVNASVVDLGFINWHSRTMTFVSHEPGKEFTYDGMSMHEFADVFKDFSKFGTKVLDSLKHLIKIDTVYDVKYRSNLPARFNIGGTYSPDEKNHINILLNGISSAHHFYPALSVSYLYNWTSYLGLTVSYNIFNRQYTNFGGGISISAGPIQLYLVSDNLPGLIFYKSTNNTSFQFGINILLKGKSAKPVPEVIENPGPSSTEEAKPQ